MEFCVIFVNTLVCKDLYFLYFIPISSLLIVLSKIRQ